MIPSDMATGKPEEIEEERRLLYVAMTRARDALYVYFPLRYYHRPKGLEDGHSYAQLSRFLTESVLDRFDRRGPRRLDEDDAVEGAPIGRVAEVESFLASLWE